MDFDIRELETNVQSVIETFTEDQKNIFDSVMKDDISLSKNVDTSLNGICNS